MRRCRATNGECFHRVRKCHQSLASNISAHQKHVLVFIQGFILGCPLEGGSTHEPEAPRGYGGRGAKGICTLEGSTAHRIRPSSTRKIIHRLPALACRDEGRICFPLRATLHAAERSALNSRANIVTTMHLPGVRAYFLEIFWERKGGGGGERRKEERTPPPPIF